VWVRPPFGTTFLASGDSWGIPYCKRSAAPIHTAGRTGQAEYVFTPVIHYLVEAVHGCAAMAHLSIDLLSLLLVASAAGSVTAAVLRSRTRTSRD
jgi:hypothetical protein